MIFQDVTDVVAMERDLRRSERLAAVGELSANIAHEIRNPLASISGSIQLLASDQETTGESARLMEIVVRETDRLNTLITDFLCYARPAPMMKSRVALKGLFEDLIEMFISGCPANIQLDLHIAEGIELEADPEQLRQLLWNLCLNAVQAMPEGGRLGLSADWARRESTQEPKPSFREGIRDVRTSEQHRFADRSDREREDQSGAWIEIAISDSGHGIPAELQENIFDPFFTTKKEGTGLGLPTVHRIVVNHGGELQLVSEEGKGTVFLIRLPDVGASL